MENRFNISMFSNLKFTGLHTASEEGGWLNKLAGTLHTSFLCKIPIRAYKSRISLTSHIGSESTSEVI